MESVHWQAIVNCDAAFDGRFVYGVRTTRVFCRPSCPSRQPKPENVRIFERADDALAAGFRPCKRCRPELPAHHPDKDLVDAAKRVLLAHLSEPITLRELADCLAVSPYHLHRVFKRVTGVTPGAFQMNIRLASARTILRNEPDRAVTDVALSLGFPSAAHFATVFHRRFGCSPSAYRTRWALLTQEGTR
ncbi:MAG: bifunctional transcriptional activator/DNA repair enzyme AdaA [Alicyclobacillus sp.]|nr:bifunctional transcriptional activator/DNA repair enzyme AdaA [Alicyclobacillus sp.]